MNDVSMIDGHIDEPKTFKDKTLEALYRCLRITRACWCCPLKEEKDCRNKLWSQTMDIINNKEADRR